MLLFPKLMVPALAVPEAVCMLIERKSVIAKLPCCTDTLPVSVPAVP